MRVNNFDSGEWEEGGRESINPLPFLSLKTDHSRTVLSCNPEKSTMCKAWGGGFMCLSWLTCKAKPLTAILPCLATVLPSPSPPWVWTTKTQSLSAVFMASLRDQTLGSGCGCLTEFLPKGYEKWNIQTLGLALKKQFSKCLPPNLLFYHPTLSLLAGK